MMLTLLLFRRINMRSKVLAKVNHYLGIKTNFRAKGINVISLHISLSVIMFIVYSGFNTFINFPVFSVLLDPFYKIPFFFHTLGLEYPARGGIQHLLVPTRKAGIKNCKYNFLGELMVWAFEHQGLQSPPSLSDAFSVARPEVVDLVPVLVNFTKRIKLCIKERHKIWPFEQI